MRKLPLLLLILPFVFGACQNNKYPELGDGVFAEFVTNKGTFVAKLYNDQTPLTVANFVSLANGTNEMVDSAYAGKPYFDGLTFHRVIKDFMIQGGDPLGNGTGNPGYRFPDEFVDSLVHNRKGLLSMANSGPGTNGSQFFVTLKETPWLNGKHSIFGEVVLGQDIVDQIGTVATSKPGDVPVEPIIMQTVSITTNGNVKVASFTGEMERMEEVKKEKEERIAKVAAATVEGFAPLKEKAETLESGLQIYWNERGEGPKPAEGSKILMNYEGYFSNGELFDTSVFEVAEKYEAVDHRKTDAGLYAPQASEYSKEARLIPGFREGLLQMTKGDKVTLFIPSHLGYGDRGYPPVIPPNSDLVFVLELVDIVQE